jgi:riboflavin kinase/FMN adenylyltransferase
VTDAPQAAIDALQSGEQGPHVVTIGNFDGVHRGHQYLLSRVTADARGRAQRSLVITFEPHPTAVLRPDIQFERLTTPARKRALIKATGVDDIVVVPFDHAFSNVSAEAFLDLLVETVAPSAVYVGSGFRFGHGRQGDGETIRSHGARHGYDTTVVQRLEDDGVTVSSSTIREALKRGDVARAARSLGRRYLLSGTVEHGAARGRALGFPTANLLIEPGICIPSDGIYAGFAHVASLDGGPRQAMVYVGTRPTFDGGARVVEVNILDFAGDLYTRELEVEFLDFVRGDQAFESAEALASQMQRDEEVTRSLLAANAY